MTVKEFRAMYGNKSRIWCGSTAKHEPHLWGVYEQHLCDGKRSLTTSLPFGRP